MRARRISTSSHLRCPRSTLYRLVSDLGEEDEEVGWLGHDAKWYRRRRSNTPRHWNEQTFLGQPIQKYVARNPGNAPFYTQCYNTPQPSQRARSHRTGKIECTPSPVAKSGGSGRSKKLKATSNWKTRSFLPRLLPKVDFPPFNLAASHFSRSDIHYTIQMASRTHQASKHSIDLKE